MSKLRVAAVSFLNARPITHGLERGLGEDRIELSFDLPARCADRYPHVVDLGQAWCETTGLPFVNAVWAGRPGAVGPAEVALLQQSLAEGLAARATIARAFAEAQGGDPALLSL